ncbi:HNH endonuclease [Alkalicoccobacillus gibsonii]|uniref:HNH endonuclease n=1 Tax=Alkalicoccobacillus gibsonii TaxID=79881 RepID=UPI00358DBEDD
MESYNKQDNLIRAALFLEYKGECFYEGKTLRFNKMHIDHIIPEATSEQRLKEIINILGLPDDFNINSLYNLVPCNPNINQIKNKNEYPIKFLGHCIHDGTYKNVSKQNDVVLIAGKGHETYQIFKDETIHFDDKEVAQAAISYYK